jgi:adenylate cyclase
LEHVDCRRNQIGDLGIVMNLPRLETLNADHNAIHLLDLSMGKHVAKVDLSNNEITKVMVSLPPFGSISLQLTTLDVSYASLTTLDGAVLNKLPTLVTLRIQHNSLAYLPDSIEELVHLETLICYENRLQRLPDTIGNLPKLTTLDAHSNNLREVPSTIWQCPSLCTLNLSSNFLITFPVPPLIPLYAMPDQTGRIADPPKNYNPSHVISSILHPPLIFSLQNLSISENKISSTDALRNISFLRSLLSLNISYNDISDLPKAFFRKMHLLEEFYSCGNALTMIPGHEEFSNLGELRRLFLGGNKLTILPAELGRLKKLKVMDVSNNCLKYNVNNYGYDWNW